MREITHYHRIFAKNIAINTINKVASATMRAPINTKPLVINQGLAVIIDTHHQLITGKPQLDSYQAQHKTKIPVIMVDVSALLMGLGLSAMIDCSALSYSQTTLIACHIEYLIGKQLDNRQPSNWQQRRVDKKRLIPGLKPEEGRRDFVSRCISVNATTYRHRKKIVLDGLSELVHAFDNRKINLKNALTIVKQSTSMRIQRQQLNQRIKNS